MNAIDEGRGSAAVAGGVGCNLCGTVNEGVSVNKLKTSSSLEFAQRHLIKIRVDDGNGSVTLGGFASYANILLICSFDERCRLGIYGCSTDRSICGGLLCVFSSSLLICDVDNSPLL